MGKKVRRQTVETKKNFSNKIDCQVAEKKKKHQADFASKHEKSFSVPKKQNFLMAKKPMPIFEMVLFVEY